MGTICTSFCFLAKPVRLSVGLLNCLIKSGDCYKLKAVSFLYIVIIVFYLKVELIINGNNRLTSDLL